MTIGISGALDIGITKLLRGAFDAESLILFDPICTYPELPQQPAESANEEKQTQCYEKEGERKNEK